uniref:MORN repeat variant n=1 Tax=Variovorax paradoxus (strain S110) TaxID=543728 RepID=C5CKG3_VARPS
MKQTLKALIAPCMAVATTFLLAACSPSTLDFRNAEIVDGKIFRAGADKPYSGHLTNVPERSILPLRQDYAAYAQTISSISLELGIPDTYYMAFCDVDAKDGVLHGRAVCRTTRDQFLTQEMGFDKGVLDGRIKTYFPGKEGKLAAEATYDNGVLDGDMTMYGPESGRKIYQASLKGGKLQGKQEMFDDKSGKLVFRTAYSKGNVDSEIVRYAQGTDRLTYRARMVGGLKDGIEEEYDVFSGKLSVRREWKMGKLHGDVVAATRGDDGGPTDELKIVDRYDNGVRVPLAPALTPAPSNAALNVQGCVDARVVAFRVQHGEDEVITADQLGEWEAECRSGKRPG